MWRQEKGAGPTSKVSLASPQNFRLTNDVKTVFKIVFRIRKVTSAQLLYRAIWHATGLRGAMRRGKMPGQ